MNIWMVLLEVTNLSALENVFLTKLRNLQHREHQWLHISRRSQLVWHSGEIVAWIFNFGSDIWYASPLLSITSNSFKLNQVLATIENNKLNCKLELWIKSRKDTGSCRTTNLNYLPWNCLDWIFLLHVPQASGGIC